MSTRWWTLGVTALAAASAVHWGLKIGVQPQAAPAGTSVALATAPASGDLTRLLGADAPPPQEQAAQPAADARFQLLGVVAPRSTRAAREGVALIAVDGQTAKAYRVGAVVDAEWVLKSVAARGAELGARSGPARVNLTLQPPAAAATGALPPVAMAQPGAQPAMPVGSPQPPPPGVQPGAQPGVLPPPTQVIPTE